METKRHKPEEIVAKLRQVEIMTAQGKSIAEAARLIGVSEQMYFRWRAEFGSMKDPLRSVQGVMNGSGQSAGVDTYDPYGQAGLSNTGRFQFASCPWIPEAGLYDNTARSYSPRSAGFCRATPSATPTA